MRFVTVLATFAALSLPSIAAAQGRSVVGALPAGAGAREAVLLSRMGPQSRAFITREAQREAANGDVSEGAAQAAAQAYGSQLGALGDGDIAALAFLVMMQASRDAQSDLAQEMAATKAINNSKARVRAETVGSGRPPVAGALQPPGPPVSRRAAEASPKDHLDSMSEMGESEQLRLQMAMDRRAKALAALSNLMKRSSDTQSSIVHNLK